MRPRWPGGVLLCDGREQRVAAGAAHPRHPAVVDQHRGSRLQHGLVGPRPAVLEAVVRHPGVHPELHRGQRAQVVRDAGRFDPVDLREGAVPRRIRAECCDLLLDVAAGRLAGAFIQARRRALDAAGHVGGRGPVSVRLGGRCRRRWRTLLRRRLGERIGPGRAGGLEEHLATAAAGPAGAAAARAGQHDGEHHSGHQRDGDRRDPGDGPPPGPPRALVRTGGAIAAGHGTCGAVRTARRTGGAARSAAARGTAGRGRRCGTARLRGTGERTRRRAFRATGGRRFGTHKLFFPGVGRRKARSLSFCHLMCLLSACHPRDPQADAVGPARGACPGRRA